VGQTEDQTGLADFVDQIKRLVKAGLFELIAIESVVTLDELSDGEAVTVPPVDEADDEKPDADTSDRAITPAAG